LSERIILSATTGFAEELEAELETELEAELEVGLEVGLETGFDVEELTALETGLFPLIEQLARINATATGKSVQSLVFIKNSLS